MEADCFKNLFDIKTGRRDNVKYIVYNKENIPVNETDNKGNIKAVPKSIASYYIFKAWAEQNPNATLSDYAEKCYGIKVEKGIFGADMKVSLLNDGPVTIILEK